MEKQKGCPPPADKNSTATPIFQSTIVSAQRKEFAGLHACNWGFEAEQDSSHRAPPGAYQFVQLTITKSVLFLLNVEKRRSAADDGASDGCLMRKG